MEKCVRICYFFVNDKLFILSECTENETESSQWTGETSEKEVSQPSFLLSTRMGYSGQFLM